MLGSEPRQRKIPMQKQPPWDAADAALQRMTEEDREGFENTHRTEWTARTPPKMGAAAPDVALWDPRTGKRSMLHDLIGENPVLVAIGSWTCPPFRHIASGPILKLYEKYQGSLDAIIIYTKEAHAEGEGEWPMPIRDRGTEMADPGGLGGTRRSQPQTLNERRESALEFIEWLEGGPDRSEDFRYPVPIWVDDVLDEPCSKFAAFPFRFFVAGPNGTLLYESGWGPFDANVAELTQWLDTNIGAAA